MPSIMPGILASDKADSGELGQGLAARLEFPLFKLT